SPFQRLKPICVELLAIGANAVYNKEHLDRTLACLRRLQSTLVSILRGAGVPVDSNTAILQAVDPSQTPALPPSLVHYVFFPISELISASPKGLATLPDRLVEILFEVLSLLGTQWWYAWADPSRVPAVGSVPPRTAKEWSVWRDLIILSTSVLGSPSKDRSSLTSVQTSDETKLASIRFLLRLLDPRFASAQGPNPHESAEKESQEWEWDGISQLPDLDELDQEIPWPKPAPAFLADKGKRVETELVFPSPRHTDFVSKDRVSKGALSFTLSTALSIAENSDHPTELRTSALLVAKRVLLLWIGAVAQRPQPPDATDGVAEQDLVFLSGKPAASVADATIDPCIQTAERLRPLLPGIASTLTRLITNKVRIKPSSTSAAPRLVPAEVAREAIVLLGDLLQLTLSDRSLVQILESEPIVEGRTAAAAHSGAANLAVTCLEDFVHTKSQAQSETENSDRASSTASVKGLNTDSPSEAPASGKQSPERWALSSLAQTKIALRSFTPFTAPSLAGTSLPSSTSPLVQRGLIELAVKLIGSCRRAFGWLDHQVSSLDNLSPESLGSSESDPTLQMLMTWLLDLSSDNNTKAISTASRRALKKLLATTAKDFAPTDLLQVAVPSTLDQLPVAIKAQDDAKASRLSLRLRTIFDLISDSAATSLELLADLLKSSGSSTKWAVRLIEQLHIDDLQNTQDPTNDTRKLVPHFQGLEASTARQICEMLRSFGRAVAIFVAQQCKSMGTVPASDRASKAAFEPVLSLLEQSNALRRLRIDMQAEQSRRKSLASLLVASQMLAGASPVLDNMELSLKLGGGVAARSARKTAHKLAKKIFSHIMEAFEGDGEEILSTGPATEQASEQSLAARAQGHLTGTSSRGQQGDETLVERLKGLKVDHGPSQVPERFGPALNISYLSAVSLTDFGSGRSGKTADFGLIQLQQYQSAETTLDRSNAVLFSMLSSCSRILGQSFRPLLLRASYPLLSGMSSTSELVRLSATAAFEQIAYNSAYADPKNCMLDQADYILGAACQRLISGLEEELTLFANQVSEARQVGNASDQNAKDISPATNMMVMPLTSAQRSPFIIVEIIRTLGSEVVPMVEDTIDEILDALDRFHAHLAICDGLLAVLGSILETMASEQTAQSSSLLRGSQPLAVSSMARDRSARTEVEDFASWLEKRRGEDNKAFDQTAETDGEKAGKVGAKKDEEDKPTKSQQVATQILTKAISFLTHPSAVLRSRVILLLKSGVESLASRKRDTELLPVINTAWPYVVTRLGLPYSTNLRTSASSNRLGSIISFSSTPKSSVKEFERKMRDLEGALVERDPGVWLSACRFIESCVANVPEFVSGRVVGDVWPRLESLLDLVKWRFDPKLQSGRMESGAASSNASSAGPVGLISDLGPASKSNTANPSVFTAQKLHSHGDAPFVLTSSTSLPAQLLVSIVKTLTHVVVHLGPRLPDEVAWSISTNQVLLSLLDQRQPSILSEAAVGLYQALCLRNPDATWLIISAAFENRDDPAAARLPCFLRQNRSTVHPETLMRIID
ncbi:hypothetical protein BCV70DRAFT_141443, partial [Testicularia cyperi]